MYVGPTERRAAARTDPGADVDADADDAFPWPRVDQLDDRVVGLRTPHLRQPPAVSQ